jgi:hypothetical protein
MSFRHLRYSGLRDLVKKQSVQGLSNLEFEKKFCEGCVMGKQTIRSFGKSQYQAKRPLKLIHTDICGPITPGSFSGKSYFITFIDDFSKKCWVYFLKEKSEAFEIFKKFKVMVEKLTGYLFEQIRQRRQVLVKRIQCILREAGSSEVLDNTLYTIVKWSYQKKKSDHNRHGSVNDQDEGNA